MKIKNIDLGKSKISIISIFFYLLMIIIVQADDLDYFGKKIDIRILDKLSSKNKLLKLNIKNINELKKGIITIDNYNKNSINVFFIPKKFKMLK